MDIYKILDQFEEEIENTKKVPLSSKLMFEKDVFLGYLDKIRSELPEEMRQARRIVNEKDKILEEANMEAEETLDKVKNKVQKIAEESEIVREAEMQADMITQEAHRVSAEIKVGAKRYADDILASVEENILKACNIIAESREELKSAQNMDNGIEEEGEEELID